MFDRSAVKLILTHSIINVKLGSFSVMQQRKSVLDVCIYRSRRNRLSETKKDSVRSPVILEMK